MKRLGCLVQEGIATLQRYEYFTRMLLTCSETPYIRTENWKPLFSVQSLKSNNNKNSHPRTAATIMWDETQRGQINYIPFNLPSHLRTVTSLHGQLSIGKYFNYETILLLLLQTERLEQQTAVIHRGRCCATPFHRVLHFRWIGEKCIQLPRFCLWNPQSSAESSLFSWVGID